MAFWMETERRMTEFLVRLRGDLDITTSPEMKKGVLDAYEGLFLDVVFELSDLEYLDSTGLGALISVYKEVKNHGHDVIIRGARTNVKKLFHITELDELFRMED